MHEAAIHEGVAPRAANSVTIQHLKEVKIGLVKEKQSLSPARFGPRDFTRVYS